MRLFNVYPSTLDSLRTGERLPPANPEPLNLPAAERLAADLRVHPDTVGVEIKAVTPAPQNIS